MGTGKLAAIVLAGSMGAAASAEAGVFITEWMYNDTPEFVELTNTGPAAVDFTGWSYDDDSRVVGVFDLGGFGVVAAGESVVLTEGDAEQFRAAWGLAASVKILGGYTNNLGRADEINIFDHNGDLVDRLAYGDQVFSGTIRTQNVSGNPNSAAALGANDVYQWSFSFVGDEFGSVLSSGAQIGNPGSYIPEPASAALLGLAGLAFARRRRA